jgi:hypothetical protein
MSTGIALLWLPERLFVCLKQKVVLAYVVTQFWTPHAGDGVYLFRTECRSLAHIRQKIDKSTERNILFFYLI